MASDLAVCIAPLKSPCGFLFDSYLATGQRESSEIVIYSQSLEGLARIAWPTIGNKKVAFYDLYYVVSYPLTVRLDVLMQTTTLEERYQTLAGPVQALTARLLGTTLPSSIPHVAGYLGDQGEQSGKVVIFNELLEERAWKYLERGIFDDYLYPREADLLIQLGQGRSITQEARDSLLSSCQQCGLHFVKSSRISHDTSCSCPQLKTNLTRPARASDYNNLSARTRAF
ncbi:hypothetical protein DFH07DRAFT_781477 [Mycena maculata]|uniref:Uncharacterized protein n=1 Tax=Mycena maculata TaxID=230809 RepID=A0AAD7HY52_9AGAR|nr:hypothetical protein DFH07DRAFT_781477 [Mycena maculata]